MYLVGLVASEVDHACNDAHRGQVVVTYTMLARDIYTIRSKGHYSH